MLYKVIRSGCTSTPDELSFFSLSSTSSGVSWTNTDENGFNLTIGLTAHTPNDDPSDNPNGTCNTASDLQDKYEDEYFKLTFTGENIQCDNSVYDPDITIKFLAHSTYHTGNIASAIGDCLIGFPSSTDAFWESIDAQDSILTNVQYPTSTAVFSSDLLLNIGMVFSQQFLPDVNDVNQNCAELKIDANDDDIDNGNIEVEFTVPGVSHSTTFFYDPDMAVKEGQLMGGFPILAAILILVVLICCCFGCCAYYCCCRKKKGGARKGAVAPKPAELA